MRREALALTLIISLAPISFASAQATDGDLVRLPGNGAVKSALPGERPVRYVPGGGLLLSFDSDADGTVTPPERATGTAAAFLDADSNGDGSLSALEQQAWAASLPTRDESLANPVRFDPNLDRVVSEDEFTEVVESIALAYVDPDTGVINVEDLKASNDSTLQSTIERLERPRRPRANF